MSNDIHPTAIVDPRVELGGDVVIGPYSIIGAGVRLGKGCQLHNHVTLAGPSEIGERNEFFPYASIGQRTQDLKYVGEPTYLHIGDDNTFREFCTVNRGTAPESRTVIGNHGNFLAYSHIAHDCIVGDHVIFSNNGTLAGHVVVEDYVILGGLTAVHQFCRIGAHAITGGCSKVIQDVPPYMVADGNPAKVRMVNTTGLSRRNFAPEVISRIKEAHRILYRGELNRSQALERIRAWTDHGPELLHLLEFVESSERGIS